MLDAILAASLVGLEHCSRLDLRGPADRRLGFRELGLAIGLAAVERLADARFSAYLPLRTRIESFWLEPRHRATRTWLEHEDINDVMLATSLAPHGFVGHAGAAA